MFLVSKRSLPGPTFTMWLVVAWGVANISHAQNPAASPQTSVNSTDEWKAETPRTLPDEDAGLRLIRENIYILRHQRIDREEEWCGAIRTLVRIGPPAVPELVRELERPNRGATLRSLGFVLRAIGDARAVPALIRAIPETLQPPGSDMGLWGFDEKLNQFMMDHDRTPGDNNGSTFSLGRPVNEILDALESITSHRIREGKDELRSVFLEVNESQNALSRDLFARRQTAWETWWSEHRPEFLAVEQLLESGTSTPCNDHVEQAGIAKFGPRFPTGSSQRLGAVREVVLGNDGMSDSRCCFDFDNHRVYAEREGVSEFKYADAVRLNLWWSQSRGVDCFAVGWTLFDFDLHVWQIDNARWNTIDREVALEQPLELGRERSRIQALLPDESGPDPTITTTFLFTTREGAQGVLQMLPHTETESTTVRYRLWNDNIAAPANDSDPKPEESEEWTEEITVTLSSPGPNQKFVAQLSSGQVLEVPAEIVAAGIRSQIAMNWYFANDCELLAEITDVSDFAAADPSNSNVAPPVFRVLGVSGREMDYVAISRNGYEQLSVSDVRDIVSRWPRRNSWADFDGSRGGNRTGFLSGKQFFHAFLTQSKRAGLLTYVTKRGETGSVTVTYRLSRPK